MAPNICKLMHSLFNPVDCHLYEQNLHYQHEPVPGIYYTDISNHRFLVAIKSNRKSDADHIFKAKESSVGFTEDLRPVSSYRGVTWASTTTLNDSTKPVDFAIEKLPYDATMSSCTRSVEFVVPKLSNPTTKNKHDRKPSLLRELAQHCLPLPFINSLAGYFGSSHHITWEDNFGGYRKLANRLEIAYCTVLKRWMFVSEIPARSKVLSIRGSEKCLALRHMHLHCGRQCAKICKSGKCGTTVEKEVFMLGDGRSYVVIGDLKKSKVFGGEIVNRRGVTSENSALFCSNGWEGMTRMNTCMLYRKRGELFAMNKEGLTIMIGLDMDYVKVVEYLFAD